MGARLQKAVVEAAPGESRLAVTADRQGRCQVALCMGLLCAVRCTLYAVRCALCAVRCALCAVPAVRARPTCQAAWSPPECGERQARRC